MATFWEIAARSVNNLFSLYLSICNIYLIPVLILRAGFAFLFAQVPVHCFSITFLWDTQVNWLTEKLLFRL